jgi:hypothetical protein
VQFNYHSKKLTVRKNEPVETFIAGFLRHCNENNFTETPSIACLSYNVDGQIAEVVEKMIGTEANLHSILANISNLLGKTWFEHYKDACNIKYTGGTMKAFTTTIGSKLGNCVHFEFDASNDGIHHFLFTHLFL